MPQKNTGGGSASAGEQCSSGTFQNSAETTYIPVIGLTGTYCSGKSSIARVLEQRGGVHIDVDTVGHETVQEQRSVIVNAFGEGVLSKEGGVDRKILGRIVFSDPAKLKLLESILHPKMRERVEFLVQEYRQNYGPIHRNTISQNREQAAESNFPTRPCIILNAAVLFTMGLNTMCDCIFLIEAPAVFRAIRGKKRDGLAWKQIIQRIRSQKNLFPQTILNNSDMYKVGNITLHSAIHRIDCILREQLWSKVEHS